MWGSCTAILLEMLREKKLSFSAKHVGGRMVNNTYCCWVILFLFLLFLLSLLLLSIYLFICVVVITLIVIVQFILIVAAIIALMVIVFGAGNPLRPGNL